MKRPFVLFCAVCVDPDSTKKVAGVMFTLLAFVMITTVQVPEADGSFIWWLSDQSIPGCTVIMFLGDNDLCPTCLCTYITELT